ncbi:MAG: response regulator [Deltaproteobacteria bacterium]|nr:response regulator [Deltaproteobacteria bacterium]
MGGNKEREKKLILVAEDSTTQAEQLRTILEEHCYEVKIARNGKEALLFAQQILPDLLLSDILMPEMDGYALCSEMKRDSRLKEIPVLLVTSLSTPKDIIKGLQCGADSFVRKPYVEDYLLLRIEYILKNYEVRKNETFEIGADIYLRGEKFTITSEKQQILDLLISTYEEAVRLNQDLEKEVRQRTAALQDEILEKKKIEDQLFQSQKMEAIGRLAGGIAHDFNNILTVIIGCAELRLKDETLNEEIRNDLAEIIRAAKRAVVLTKQLLAFSRRQIVQPRPIDLNELVLSMDEMLRRLLGEDIELHTLQSNENMVVKVDPVQVEQVVLNLAINARDAMPQGGKLEIEAKRVTLDEVYARDHFEVVPGEYVMIAVSDTGGGMSREVQSHLFEPFFTTKEKGRGTGLGLATSYGIVKQAGGHIGYYSEVGKGTTFKIYLPFVHEKAEPFMKHKVEAVVPRGSETILLVEDDVAVRGVITRGLKDFGYHVLEAGSGKEALILAKNSRDKGIHLLMTDVVMPEMDGKELAAQAQLVIPGIRVLYASGYTDNSIVKQGILEPDLYFIQKPFSLHDLARKIREILDAQKTRQAA